MLLHKDREQFEAVLNAVSNELGVPVSIVEKDYYVTMILKQLVLKASGCVFKGGTSLSKAYGLIDRFSEDIDLSMNRKPTEGEKKQTKNLILNIVEGLGLIVTNPEDIQSRHSYNKYVFK